MTRKRLTSETLDNVQERSSAVLAADLSQRLLGRGATEQEVVTMGSLLFKSMGPENVRKAHRMAAAVMSEVGETFDDEEVDADEGNPQPDPTETQSYVRTVETTPNESVLPVAMKSNKPPSQEKSPRGLKIGGKKPEKGNRKAAEEDEEEELDEDLDLPEEDQEEEAEDTDTEEFDAEEPEGEEDFDLDEEGAEDFDEDEDEMGDIDAVLGEAEDGDEEAEDDVDIDEVMGMDHVGLEDEDPIDFEPGMVDHEGGNVEGIDQEGYYENESRKGYPGWQPGKEDQQHDLTEEEVGDFKRYMGLKGLGGSGSHDTMGIADATGKQGIMAGKKGGKKQKPGKEPFRPSRTRVASRREPSDEFEGVFGDHDMGPGSRFDEEFSS